MSQLKVRGSRLKAFKIQDFQGFKIKIIALILSERIISDGNQTWQPNKSSSR